MIEGYQWPLFRRYSSQDIHRFRMSRRGRGRPPCRRGRAPPFRLGLSQPQLRRAMGSGPNRIARSPTPPDTDDDGEEWPVHGIVGEDVDVFGISSYEVRWQNWSRSDGTNTNWMRDIEGDPDFVVSWNEAIKYQRVEKASESQSIDLMPWASIPMHDRLTFECAQAAREKMTERLRKGAPDKVYQGWKAEIDRQVSHHQQRGEKNNSSSSTVPKKRSREPSLRRSSAREESYAESSRLAASRKRQVSVTWDIDREETLGASDGDFGSETATLD